MARFMVGLLALLAGFAAPSFAQDTVKIGYAISRTGPFAAGAQISQEPNYILWAEQVNARGAHAEHVPERAAIGERLIGEARPGDRILIMGARDDTLAEFARELAERLKPEAG